MKLHRLILEIKKGHRITEDHTIVPYVYMRNHLTNIYRINVPFSIINLHLSLVVLAIDSVIAMEENG